VGIPVFGDFQGAVGAVGNLGLVFHRFHGPVFSTALWPWFRVERWLSIGAIAADDMRAEADGHGRIQMLVDGHGAAGQGVPEPRLLQLPVSIGDRHGIVLGHDALGLHGEDPVQVRARGPAKRGSFVWGRDDELLVEGCDVMLS